jgi:CheY-like chemotaxis protein
VNDISLRGQRVLLVEDSATQARQYSSLLKKAGAVVVGPAKTVAAAERLISMDGVAAAWLDVCLDEDIDGAKVWPVAELLSRLDIPFLFCTYSPDEAELAKWPGRPIVPKPLRSLQAQNDVIAKLADLIDGAVHNQSAKA